MRAKHSAVIVRTDLSVRLSVRPSITFRCFVETNEDTIVRSTLSARTIIPVSTFQSLSGYSQGITPSEGVKVKHPHR